MRLPATLLATTLAAAVLAGALAGGATAQDVKSKSKSKAEESAFALRVKKGDTLRFRRTRERVATCEALGRDGDDKVVQDYTVTVESVADDGGVVLDVRFAHATGHFKRADGERLAIDTSKGHPDVETMPDLIISRSLSFLGGARVKVTLDARGRVVAEEGMRDAVKAAFAGTDLAAMSEEYPQEEGLGELWAFFPPLPKPGTADGATWEDETTIDFGARSAFDFDRAWTLTIGEDTVTTTAECVHVPGDKVPAGQTNQGSGRHVCVRSRKDGFVTKQTIEATFQGRGNFDIDTKLTETLERLPAE